MKTQSAHELRLQAWWDETLIYSDQFFDTTATLSAYDDEEMLPLFGELQSIRQSFANAEYPTTVSDARQCLLNSMAEVMLSFQAFFAGDANAARLYMQTAQYELHNLQQEMDRIGMGAMSGSGLVH